MCPVVFATRFLWVLSAVLAVGAGFFLLLERSGLEAERLNVGTLLGRNDPSPQVELWTLGIVLGVAAFLAAGAALALGRTKRAS
jgi:hypothetical protein